MRSASILFAACVASEAFYVCLAGGGSGSCGSSVSEAAETAASVDSLRPRKLNIGKSSIILAAGSFVLASKCVRHIATLKQST